MARKDDPAPSARGILQLSTGSAQGSASHTSTFLWRQISKFHFPFSIPVLMPQVSDYLDSTHQSSSHPPWPSSVSHAIKFTPLCLAKLSTRYPQISMLLLQRPLPRPRPLPPTRNSSASLRNCNNHPVQQLRYGCCFSSSHITTSLTPASRPFLSPQAWTLPVDT